MRAAVAVSVLASASAVPFWPAEGGDMYRTNSKSVAVDYRQVGNRGTYKIVEPVNTDFSTIEDSLLQQPLITSWGAIVVVSDDMAVSLYPDPATLAPGAVWTPLFGPWTTPNPLPVPDWEKEDTVFGGMILDGNDILYMVDQRNRAVRAVQLTSTGVGFSELPASPYWWNRSIPFTVPHPVSLSIINQFDTTYGQVDQLWLPVGGSLEGVAGLAIVIPTLYFSNPAWAPAGTNGGPFFVPLPNGRCRYPEDQGSVALPASPATGNLQAVFMLGQQDCGAVAMTADVASMNSKVEYYTAPDSYAFSSDGQHAHPIYDAASQSLLWIDYSVRYGVPQQLCCGQVNSGFGSCGNNKWDGQCLNLPAETYDPLKEVFSAWEWLSLAIAGDKVVVVAGGYLDVTNSQVFGQIMVFSLVDGSQVGKWRTESDLFNSAPLVVAPTDATVGGPRVYVTGALGNLYCFDPASPGSGPVWKTSGEIGAIPAEDMPQSTYTYMTLTPAGTLLVTASAGGKDWSDEKTVYAIVNGLQTPPASSINAALQAAIIGSVVGLLLVGAAGGGFAYYRSPSFRSTVNGGLDKVVSAVRGKKAYSSVGMTGGASAFTGPTSSINPAGASASVGAGTGFNSSGGYGGI